MATTTLGSGSNRVWVQQAAIDSVRGTNRPSFRRSSTSTNSNNPNNNSSTSIQSSCEDSSSASSSSLALSHGRHLTWGWKRGTLVESTSDVVLVQLDDDEEQVGMLKVNNEESSPSSSSSLIRLSANALQDGQVVLSNDYEISTATTDDNDDGNNNNNNNNNIVEPPNDLITLIHLHEPAVVESLQHRYAADKIYTNTGPVLLALNPFQTMRGLYSESVMKKYWEKAERNQNISTELPPHVYAIADTSFRSMMRALEDTVDAVVTMDDSTSSLLSSTSINTKPNAANQSILVSGESGAGKTVTTKFVMKYLAALSQRSVVLHEPSPRAYVLAAKAKAAKADQNNSNNSNKKPTKTYQPPSWANNSNKKTFSKSLSTQSSTDALASVSLLTTSSSSSSLSSSKNSIEAQVLQSNPILESFGNARTVRNDNSSRFGKFIEIQFDMKGKLVGAQIETYLLEKVRLCSRSSGERNYHVFYELLSGAVDKNELSSYYLAPTARPQDFTLTTSASNTYDRRDGVSDQDTCRQLRNAMNTMKFSHEEIKDVFKVTSAILHVSNLTFMSLSEETCQLKDDNVHLQPVCRLLGVALEDLNKALCSFSIQAGDHVVQRTLNQAKAEKGLEALLKSTYGALFTYLVNRINDSIAFKKRKVDSEEEENDDDDGEEEEKKVDDHSNVAKHHVAATAAATTTPTRPAATIGVLDIFGFESFNVNSFEQLCINYCNEALQQQFNAFVLKNEQAEYEREGIEWSFIEFPENQDVLDLIEKRGAGILSILDDQCRAPGPSDKAFCLDVYNKCTGQSRFQASRKQTATLQFSVKHYAGPVEYTAEGFTEKNRDELPKESTELLRNSSIPFIRHLAEIIDHSHELPPLCNNGGVSVGDRVASPTKQMLRRADSSVGRATVGGQFRSQLRNLRRKIDLTTPHYVRCLKPNDLLVPDHFDTAIVAEQLRCGGILEAVRVARAGFTQHYPHVDFVRRYRALAWRELSKKDYSFAANAAAAGAAPRSPVSWKNGSKSRSSSSNFRNSYVPTVRHHHQPTNKAAAGQKQEMSAADAKVVCKDLLKVLYRKILQLEKNDGNESTDASMPSPAASPSPAAAKAKSYSYNKSPSPPAWSKPEKMSTPPVSSYLPPTTAGSSGSVKSRHAAWEKKSEPQTRKEPATPPPTSTGTWKRGGLTSSDYAKVGIQMGKTKVFLRHKAFEALERIRSAEQTRAATKLNSIFRRYLARLAYIPFRDAFRKELHERCRMFEEGEEFKESKEQDYGDENDESSLRFRASALAFHKGGSFASFSLVDKWMESRIRDAIHNPVPRHEWGKELPSEERFKWILSDGLWVKNYNYSDDDGTTTTTSHDDSE